MKLTTRCIGWTLLLCISLLTSCSSSVNHQEIALHSEQPPSPPSPAAASHPGQSAPKEAPKVITDPNSITVLVNKQFILPPDYVPDDLVYPDVPFLFKEKVDKRKMRNIAASALEQLFATAQKDGIFLAGVSAYRSYNTQKMVFNNYLEHDLSGNTNNYSAVPGTSEHQTGLAIDVSGKDGKCAATDCFAGTKEAQWLANHAHEFGFIVRYQQGKEAITGYQYEPWHIRYVGTKAAKDIFNQGITLEEYFSK